MMTPCDCLLLGSSVEFGMEIEATLAGILLFFDDERMGLGEGILADSGNLPGNVDVRLSGLDGELVVGNPPADDGLSELPKHGELIAEIGVDGLEPVGETNFSVALSVGSDVAAVYVHHFRRLDGGVIEVLIGRIERVIDLEVLGAGGD